MHIAVFILGVWCLVFLFKLFSHVSLQIVQTMLAFICSYLLTSNTCWYLMGLQLPLWVAVFFRFFYQNEIAYCSMCLLKEALHFNSISDYALPVVRLLTCNYLWKFVIVCYPTKTEFCVHKFWTNVYFFLIGLSTTHKMFTCYLKQSVVIQFE